MVLTVSTLAAMVVSCLLIIQFLDRPFADRSGIRPTEMMRTLELMDRLEGEGGPVAPCDPSGTPIHT